MELVQCVICRTTISDKSYAVQLREKGSLTINNISTEKGDSLITKPGEFVHAACRKKYTHPTTVARELTPRKCDNAGADTHSLRSQIRFKFATQCLFCGQVAKSSNKKRGLDVFQVRTNDFQNVIIKVCEERVDERASQVPGRITFSRCNLPPDL